MPLLRSNAAASAKPDGPAVAVAGSPVMGAAIAAITACALALGCGPRPPSASPTGTPSPGPSTASAGPGASAGPAAAGFQIGIEYGVPGLAAAYTPTGLTRAKPALEHGVWGNLEPTRGRREFRPLDTLIAEYQAAGFRDLQLLISADSPWAARKAGTDPFPQDAFLGDYVDFVRAVVERYDGDGQGDAPGLRYPVHEYGIEREFTGFWGSSAADYVRLLGLAAPAIRDADPAARVLLVAILAIDVFDGSPDAALVERRWQTNQPFRKSRADVVTILAACDLYDEVDVHSLGDATELPATVAWIRSRLAEARCPDRPVFVGDAFPMSVLLAYNARPFHPATGATRPTLTGVLGAAVDPGDPEHPAALAWVRAEVGRGLVRKSVLAAAAGARGINLGNLEDWTTGLVPADRLLTVGIGTAAISGHLDTSITGTRPGGPLPYHGDGFSRARRPADQRASFAALRLVGQTLQGATTVTRIDAGDPAAWVYAVEAGGRRSWIAWADDASLALPGASPLAKRVELRVDAARVEVTRTPTERPTLDEPTTVAAANGTVALTLDRTPVVIVPR
jgi:hypothetical protein